MYEFRKSWVSKHTLSRGPWATHKTRTVSSQINNTNVQIPHTMHFWKQLHAPNVIPKLNASPPCSQDKRKAMALRAYMLFESLEVSSCRACKPWISVCLALVCFMGFCGDMRWSKQYSVCVFVLGSRLSILSVSSEVCLLVGLGEKWYQDLWSDVQTPS